jgi:hypothetical protein
MSSPPISAFVSYAKADQAKALEIAEALERRGFRCWIAPRDVRPGRAYGDEIIRGIESSSALVLVLSSASNTSGFVSREIERAVSKNKPIFTVRIEDVLPSPSLELFISSTQWIDAFSGRLGPQIDRLAQFLAEDETGSAAPPAMPAGQASRPRGWRSPWILGGAAAVLLGIVALGAVLLFPRQPEPRDDRAAAALREGFFGPDTRRKLDDLSGEAKLPPGYAAIGWLARGDTAVCNATLVGADLILTSNYCLAGNDPRQFAFFVRGPGGKLLQSRLNDVLTSAPIRGVAGEQRVAVAKLASPLGRDVGWVKTVGGDPAVGDKLDIVAIDIRPGAADRMSVMVSGAATGDRNCAVLGREDGLDVFAHRCVSPEGSGGAPIFDAASGALVGLVGETHLAKRVALAYRTDEAADLIREAAAASASEALTGTWTGSGNETRDGAESTSYPVVMRISEGGGSIDYPSLGCGGSLTALSASGEEARFREHITYGECVDGGTIEVKLSGGKLDWRWSGGDGVVVTAELESTGK